MHKASMILACCALFVIPTKADPGTVSYTTTGAGPLAFQADAFSLTGQTGSLTLDTILSTRANINTAVFFTGDSGNFSGSNTLTLTYDLTLDGVTQSFTQTATWIVAPSLDTFTAAFSSPVLFNTAAGSWDVTLEGYYLFATPGDIGTSQRALTYADFVPLPAVPEPGTLPLFSAGLLMLGTRLRKRHQHRA